MTGRLAGKVAIVTGGTGALGRTFSLALAREGARVVATGRNEERGTETARLITEAGGEAMFLPHDVTSADDWARVIDTTLGTGTSVHIYLPEQAPEDEPAQA